MINYKEFYPDEGEPQAVVIIPNLLASTFETDFEERSTKLANVVGALVVAYERPGTGSTYDTSLGDDLTPANYVNTAAQTGRELEIALDKIGTGSLKRVLAGHSAAAAEASILARANTLGIDYLLVTDPTGLKDLCGYKGRKFALNWVKFQKEDSAQQSEESAEQSKRSPLETINMFSRIKDDFMLYVPAWGSTVVLEALTDISEQEEFYGLAVDTTLVGHSFSSTPDEAQVIIDRLSGNRPEGTAKFTANFMPNVWHSHFTESSALGSHIISSLGKLGLPLDKTA